jgi:3-hydroxyisobutyrate dehydrogenase
MINLMGAVQIASAAEGVVLAERAGLDLRFVADGIASGQAASPQVVRNVRRFILGDHSTHITFTPALRLKDIDYALRLARKIGVVSEFGAAAERLYRRACELGFAGDNESRVVDVVRDSS